MTSERKPLCSIGMPVYNGERYLREAISSVLQQDMEDFELIISDNASTDGTAEICAEFATQDPRIVYVRQPRNIGAAKNYNYVFHLARGTYFNWLAHDDLLEPGFLSACIAGFEASDAATVLIYPEFRYIDGSGHLIRNDEPPTCVHTSASGPARRLFETLESLNVVTSIFGVFKRDALARTRLIGSYIASDYVLLAECALLGKIIHLRTEAPLFCRRLHDAGSQRANKTPTEVAAWFDPDANVDNRPFRRVTREYFNAVLTIPGLSLLDRIASIALLSVQRLLLKGRVIRMRQIHGRKAAT